MSCLRTENDNILYDRTLHKNSKRLKTVNYFRKMLNHRVHARIRTRTCSYTHMLVYVELSIEYGWTFLYLSCIKNELNKEPKRNSKTFWK